MRIKPKEVKAKVTLLRNPSPVAMAIVDQGACQTPFNVLKRAVIATKSGAKTMSKLRLKKGKGASRKPLISKMQFSKAKYATEEDVKKYLTSKGIEGFADIEDGDDVWIVPTAEDLVGKTAGKAKATPGRDAGVTVFVVEAKSDDKSDDDTDEDEDADDADDGDDDTQKRASKAKLVDGKATKTKKSEEADSDPVLELPPELATKFDWWGAYMSGETSLVDVLKDGMSYDALPPGMQEVFAAVGITTGNVLADGDLDVTQKKEKLIKMGSEFAELTIGLFELFDRAVVDATKHVDADVRKSAKKFSDSFAEGVAAARKGKAIPLTLSAEEPENDDDTTDGDNVIANNDVIDMLGGIVKRLDKIEKTTTDVLSRGTTRKSMTDSLEDLIDDEEDNEEQVELRKQVIDDMRTSLGGSRPRSGS